MKIPRFSFVLLLLCAAFSAAQTAPAPPVTSPTAPRFEIRSFCASPWVICDTFGAPPGQTAGASAIKPLVSTFPGTNVMTAMGANAMPKTCYTVRAYEYSTGEAGRGKVRRTGMTSCQPATNFHMKSATLVVPAPGQSR